MNKTFFIILVLFSLVGCATHQKVTIKTDPPGADIYVSGIPQGKSPVTVKLLTDAAFTTYEDRKHIIIAKKPGYEDEILTLQSPSVWLSDTKPFPESITLTLKNEVRNQISGKKVDHFSKEKLIQHRPQFSRNQNWAVIIGISTYKHSGQNNLTNLIFADDDAKSFTRSLRNLGWSENHIKLLTNEEATQRNIMIALKSWLTKSGPDDQVILFWAGHGYPDPEDPEKVYLATYDTDINIPATGYRMDEVRKALEEIGSKNVIVFADTCHAGKLITRGNGSRGISIVPNIKQQNTPKGWVFMVGADTDRQAIEDTSWSNGAFTHSLVNGLNGAADGFQSIGPKDGIVTMGELRAYMNTAMPEETQKVLGVAKRPVITTSTGDPDIWNLTLQVK